MTTIKPSLSTPHYPFLDDSNDQLKLEGWLYIVFIFDTLFNEEAPFYWLSERGGTISLSKFGRRLVKFFIYDQNYAGGWLEFHFMVQALPEGLVI